MLEINKTVKICNHNQTFETVPYRIDTYIKQNEKLFHWTLILNGQNI
jgi:hypothetical protein